MFHDPVLERTTDSTGRIKDRFWHGEKGMQHIRTKKEPKQGIPTFEETVALLMRPENQRVKLNVDVKVQNKPDHLFPLMFTIISAQPEWETLLAPRIILGLWHPGFLSYAKVHLPYCRRSHIGRNLYVARKYFWDDCDIFSMSFPVLTSGDGQRFRMECNAAGKKLIVWTVNRPDHMMEAVRWQVDGIITDVPKSWFKLRAALQTDYEKINAQHGRVFLWTTLAFYMPFLVLHGTVTRLYLEHFAGSFNAISSAS